MVSTLEQRNAENEKSSSNPDHQGRRKFISIHGVPIYFREAWETGIGGGLWSTGLALAYYFGTTAAVENMRRIQRRKESSSDLSVLELGSGNGFLAVCLAALSQANGIPLKHLVVTDTDDHLDMIRQTMRDNAHATTKIDRVTVVEHCWGNSPPNAASKQGGENELMLRRESFDLIIGSDVAYRAALYDPLICSLLRFSNDNTVSLIGVTMADTTPEFFKQLSQAGFEYQMFASHLLRSQFRGNIFGVFCIKKKRRGD